MPLTFNDPTTPLAKATAQTLRDQTSIAATFQQMQRLFKNLYAFIWDNPSGLTPQQAFDVYGTDAAALMNEAAGYAAYLLARDGTAATGIPAGFTLTKTPTALSR